MNEKFVILLDGKEYLVPEEVAEEFDFMNRVETRSEYQDARGLTTVEIWGNYYVVHKRVAYELERLSEIAKVAELTQYTLERVGALIRSLKSVAP